MRIFYAIQATGNGHIARAIEILPYLKKYGEVDIFLSGSNATLRNDFPVKYLSKGVSLFYNSTGSLNYWEIVKQLNWLRIRKEAKNLPVNEYDIIISDFELISCVAARLHKKPLVHLGHQASFASDMVPRPTQRKFLGELIIKNYCKSKINIGYHFYPYEKWILPPVIKKQLWQAEPKNKGHLTVYLPQYSRKELHRYLFMLDGIKFEIFHKEINKEETEYNITWKPIDNERFTASMINSAGVLTGAGFETPSEALFLKKKLMVIPIRGQYEQLCNAAALSQTGVSVVEKLDVEFGPKLEKWLKINQTKHMEINFISTKESVDTAMEWITKSVTS